MCFTLGISDPRYVALVTIFYCQLFEIIGPAISGPLRLLRQDVAALITGGHQAAAAQLRSICDTLLE
jgi:hypothetical protein